MHMNSTSYFSITATRSSFYRIKFMTTVSNPSNIGGNETLKLKTKANNQNANKSFCPICINQGERGKISLC